MQYFQRKRKREPDETTSIATGARRSTTAASPDLQHLQRKRQRQPEPTTRTSTGTDSATVAAAPDNWISLGDGLGCTVIYEGEQPLLAEYTFFIPVSLANFN
jgi:hypothetical protein